MLSGSKWANQQASLLVSCSCIGKIMRPTKGAGRVNTWKNDKKAKKKKKKFSLQKFNFSFGLNVPPFLWQIS